MKEAQTQEGIRDERLRFLADFVITADARLGGRIAQAGCLPNKKRDSHQLESNADVDEEEGETLQQRIRNLVLGIKRLRLLARNGSVLFCAPDNTSLERCSDVPQLLNVTCSANWKITSLIAQGHTPQDEECPDCSNAAELELRKHAKIIEILVWVLK